MLSRSFCLGGDLKSHSEVQYNGSSDIEPACLSDMSAMAVEPSSPSSPSSDVYVLEMDGLPICHAFCDDPSLKSKLLSSEPVVKPLTRPAAIPALGEDQCLSVARFCPTDIKRFCRKCRARVVSDAPVALVPSLLVQTSCPVTAEAGAVDLRLQCVERLASPCDSEVAELSSEQSMAHLHVSHQSWSSPTPVSPISPTNGQLVSSPYTFAFSEARVGIGTASPYHWGEPAALTQPGGSVRLLPETEQCCPHRALCFTRFSCSAGAGGRRS